MKNRILLVLAGMLAFTFTAHAQKYITAAGIRIGKEQFGLTVQQRILSKSTLEIIGLASSRQVSGTVLFEQHFPVITKGLNYYIGAGAHVGNIKDRGDFYGVDGIMGLEAKVLFTRLLLSADLKPAIHINHEDWFNFQGGFSIRYILIKERKKKLNLFGGGKSGNGGFGGIFGTRKKEKEKSSFNWFGVEEEKKEKMKFKFFPDENESDEEEEGNKKFKLFE